jgi:steroid 5-alpha reductase family enzyme
MFLSAKFLSAMSLSAIAGFALAIGLFLFLTMSLAWAVRMKTGNSGWIDAIWSAAVGLAGVAAILFPAPNGVFPRKVLAAALVLFWSARLTLHIARRTHGARDDPRYAALAREWGADFPRKLLVFLQIQAVAALPLALAVVTAARAPHNFPAATDFLAGIVAVAAILGEGQADAQLARFARSAPKGSVCDVGLWAHSRHPNYFFEFLFWCAWPIMAFDPSGAYPQGLIALAAPVLIYALLNYVSGVPPLEKNMRATRGEAFAAYCGRVNRFFPGPARAP